VPHVLCVLRQKNDSAGTILAESLLDDLHPRGLKRLSRLAVLLPSA
jgi:hypothetical protein